MLQLLHSFFVFVEAIFRPNGIKNSSKSELYYAPYYSDILQSSNHWTLTSPPSYINYLSGPERAYRHTGDTQNTLKWTVVDIFGECIPHSGYWFDLQHDLSYSLSPYVLYCTINFWIYTLTIYKRYFAQNSNIQARHVVQKWTYPNWPQLTPTDPNWPQLTPTYQQIFREFYNYRGFDFAYFL